MQGIRRRELLVLIVGDTIALTLALWLTLAVRYFEIPSRALLELHLPAFAVLFILSIIIFFIAGLYDKHTVILKKRLPVLVTRTQLINVTLAALMFFSLPVFGIAPKTNLLIYLVFSSLLLILWRLRVVPWFAVRKRRSAILIGSGEEAAELYEEVNRNTRYELEFVARIDPGALSAQELAHALTRRMEEIEGGVVVADFHHPNLAPALPLLFVSALLDFKVLAVDLNRLYEDIFDRVPLSTLNYLSLIEQLSGTTSRGYDFIKRGIDIAAAFMFLAAFAVLLPVVWLLMRLEGRGPLFIAQQRLGLFGRPITVYKIRTMRDSDSGVWLGGSSNKVTRIGRFLRTLSIDELPQMLNVLKGEMSLIGPRNDIAGIAAQISEAIPFYNVRYIVRPGISGWAQTHQMYAPGNISPQSLEESKVRLAYDLFYIRRRSLMLDGIIVLRTIATLLSRLGTFLGVR